MSRRDVQGYAQDMIAMSEAQITASNRPKPPSKPTPPRPVLLPASPPAKPR